MPDIAVRHSSYFEEQLTTVRQNAGRSPFHRTVDHLVSQALKALTTSGEAFADHRRMGAHKHDFTGIFRFKGQTSAPWERGIRILFIGNEETRRVFVLEYGERIPGSADDVYEQFASRLTRGYYDPYFMKLDLRHAYCKVPPPPQRLSSSQRT